MSEINTLNLKEGTILKVCLSPFLLLFSACLMSGGCSEKGVTKGVMLGVDISKSLNSNCVPTAEAVMHRLQYEIGYSEYDAHFKPGAVVYLTTIGTSDLPEIMTITLEPAPSALFDNLKARREEVQRFMERLRQGVTALMDKPREDQFTNIQGSLCHLFEFAHYNDSTTNHKVILLTDGSHDAHGVDFDTYPDSLGGEVSDKLDALCSLGDLSTFEINITVCAENDTPWLTYRNVTYWRKQLREAGAKVSAISNL